MARRILDTNKLLSYWNKCFHERPGQHTEEGARGWARELITIHGSSAILSPILIEVLVGTTTQLKLRLTRAFLDEFEVLDKGHISAADWQMALRYAERIPLDAKPRDFGDCLINAIADRLHHEVFSDDKSFNRARSNPRRRRRKEN